MPLVKDSPLNESAEQVVSRALDPGEKIVWCGRPDVDALLEHRAGEETLARKISLGPTRSGQLLPSRAIRPWAESLTYAITDRRLLILEGDVVTDAYTADLLRIAPRLEIRGPSHGDVIFGTSEHEDGFPTAPDRSLVRSSLVPAIAREQMVKAFKALGDVESVKQSLDDWLRGHEERVRLSLRDFVGRSGPDDEEHARLVTNARLGLSIVIPSGLALRVRERAAPTGKLVAEIQSWSLLGDSDTWNTLEGRATRGFEIYFELLESPRPTMSLKKLEGGFIKRLLVGKILGVQEDLVIGTFRGFAVRRSSRADGTVIKQVLLHDGRRQFFSQGDWPEGWTEGEPAIDSIVQSLRVE